MERFEHCGLRPETAQLKIIHKMKSYKKKRLSCQPLLFVAIADKVCHTSTQSLRKERRGIEVESERFASADAFLFRYAEDKSFDLLLLDVEMQGTDGVTLAKTVRQENEAVQIVFITGYSDYIAEGYDVAALHYLVKPVSREKLFAVLDRAWEKHRRNARCLNLELSGELVRLPLYEVRYLDVHQNYVTVHARQDYTVKRTLGEFEAQLDEGFLRVGMILNLKQIRRVTKKEVVLADGTALPLPRGAYEPLNRAIIERT